jgi:glycosyltransferase involved in cell wall biosynthesis
MHLKAILSFAANPSDSPMEITAQSAGSIPATRAKRRRRVLIIVQNLPLPFDRRVWQEATELVANDYAVSVICPKGKGYERSYECLNNVHIYRHPLPFEAGGLFGYLLEYMLCLFFEFTLALRVLFTRGFDVIHACNPPDNIFLIGGFFKLFGKKFLFDHHDINPELYEAKFHRRDIFHWVMLRWERLTFMAADVSIATNNSYREIALTRGRMDPDKVFVVRSGPSLDRMKILPPVQELKRGRRYLIGYVGVMGRQEGIEYLIEVARILVHDMKRTDVHFALVGAGPSLENLKKLAGEKAVRDFMTFTGRAPDQLLLEVLNTADVCVNPDEVNPMNDKSTMNKIMEYMALGKPIIQFDVTEGRFSAGPASLYAKANDAKDMADAVVYLLDRPGLREEMGRQGRLRVENELAWPYEAPKLLAAYNAIFADAI